MKTSSSKRAEAGYVSTLLVLTTGAVLSVLTVYAYRSAVTSQGVQAQVQLRLDYSEKEEAILRSIVAIAPNRAIQAMQSGSDANAGVSDPLRWQNIFTESLDLANARTAISNDLLASISVNLRKANSGDGALNVPSRIFKAISPDTGFVSRGLNRSLGTGYPVPLTSNDSTVTTRDAIYPIITHSKVYGTLAQSGVALPVATYPNFNLLKYPDINFGYAKPGDNFVAKENWWAFSLDVAEHDDEKTYLAKQKRDFVFSIYEIPSQLAISASSFMSLGQFSGGDAWQNVTISGGVFAGKAEVLGTTEIPALASRRSVSLSSGTTIGGQSFTGNPFTPGVREAYQVTTGAFFPVSQSSESGRSVFIPINRGAAYFDRFDPVENAPESNTLSPTSWNNYSIGANQCAMRLDITGVTSPTNSKPTMLRFEYYLNSGTRTSMNIPLTAAVQTTLPPGYVAVCEENQSWTFSSTVPVDVAYGKPGGFTFRQGVTGTIAFNNATFGDPLVGTLKTGYWRPRAPFEVQQITSGPNNGQHCVAVYPERIPAFLGLIGAAAAGPGGTVAPNYNNSLVVNVDYSNTGLNNAPTYKPRIPCTATDYGVILKECANLTSFTRGFSLVSNLRLYIGDDFNTTAGTPPAGYTPTGSYFPPCSLFAPEKRYGVDINPFNVVLRGQIGSLASESEATAVRPLDSKTLNGQSLSAANITVNLRPITHPADLPPITMMNWLVLLEERRKEFY
jgi:hypothetical protein